MWTNILFLLTIFSVWSAYWAIRSCLNGYGLEKGKRLARQEDLEKLVKEVKTFTEAAEIIKQGMSHDYWNRQRQWELKRDVLFRMAKAMTALHAALAGLTAVSKHFISDDFAAKAAAAEWAKAWSDAFGNFDEVRTLVEVVCGVPTMNACDEFCWAGRKIADKLLKGDAEAYEQGALEFAKKGYGIKGQLRFELGLITAAHAPIQ